MTHQSTFNNILPRGKKRFGPLKTMRAKEVRTTSTKTHIVKGDSLCSKAVEGIEDNPETKRGEGVIEKYRNIGIRLKETWSAIKFLI